MAIESTNPGFIDAEAYKVDPANVDTPQGLDHSEHRQGMDSELLSSQSTIEADLVARLPTQDEKDALNANAGLNAGNGVVSQSDLVAAVGATFQSYVFRTSTGVPASGEVTLDHATPASAAEVKVHNINANGDNFSNLFLGLGNLDKVVVQDKDEADKVLNFDVTGTPTQTGGTGAGGYVTVPVSLFDEGGTSLADSDPILCVPKFEGNNTIYSTKAANLSDLADAGTSRTNLDVYSKAETDARPFLDEASNLSDVANVATSRSNLSVSSTAEANALYLQILNNLSDVNNVATARTNLGLAIGTDVQAYHALLADIAAITFSTGDIIKYDGANLITLAATAGDVMIGNVSGHWAPLAKGSDDEILTLASGLPVWAAPAVAPAVTGELVLIEEQVASADASLDFTTGIDGTYDTYLFRFIDVKAATTGDYFYCRVSEDGGSTFLSGSTDYAVAMHTNDDTDTVVTVYNKPNNISLMTITPNLASNKMGSGVAHFFNGQMEMFQPADAGTTGSLNILSSGAFVNDADHIASVEAACRCRHVGLTDVDAVQFAMSTGNIASGTIQLYGMKK